MNPADWGALGVLTFLIGGLLKLVDKYAFRMASSLETIADAHLKAEKENERRHGETSLALRVHTEQLDQIVETQRGILNRINPPPSANGGQGMRSA